LAQFLLAGNRIVVGAAGDWSNLDSFVEFFKRLILLIEKARMRPIVS
jgi:hypothetical protein